MKKLKYTILICFGLIACSTNSNKNTVQNVDTLTKPVSENKTEQTGENEIELSDYLVKNTGTSTDIYDVPTDCALLLQMPDNVTDSLQAASEEYVELSEDENWASINAYNLLDTAGIKTESTPKRFIRYVHLGDTILIDAGSGKEKLYGCYIFFKSPKKPKIYDCSMVDEVVINKFFKQ